MAFRMFYIFQSVIMDLNSFHRLFIFYLEIQFVYNFNCCVRSFIEGHKCSGFSFFNVGLKINTSSPAS